MTYIKIERPDGDLRTEVWSFYYFNDRHTLVLDRYERCERASRRHKFRTLERYDRLDAFGWGTDPHIPRLRLEAVPWPDDVIAEARARFAADLRISQSMEALQVSAAAHRAA